MLRNRIVFACVAAIGIFGVCGADSANAGLRHKKSDCCEPACPPVCEPVCPPVCEPKVPVTLTFCHPVTGCPLCAEVCVPACCAAECPKKDYRCALIGVGVYTFTWCCGHEVKIRLMHHNKLIVKD